MFRRSSPSAAQAEILGVTSWRSLDGAPGHATVPEQPAGLLVVIAAPADRRGGVGTPSIWWQSRQKI